jgi:glycosyltransferase involved in cell wall biosynthesis
VHRRTARDREGRDLPPRLRLLLISSLYPTPDRPDVGPFVERRVADARAHGTIVRVVAAASYRGSVAIRYSRLAWAAMTARGTYDGVETHVLFPTGLIGLVAARLRSIPHVVYVHGSDVAVTSRRSRLHRWLTRVVARSAARVVTNSEDTAGLVRDLGVEPIVVSPGVDLARFRPGDQGAARKRTGLPADARIALFCGRLIDVKGADTFAEAMDSAHGWLGVMVGVGDLARTIEERHQAIRLVGRVASAAVPEWLRSADVVVVPSRRESLGLVAIEALACGVPVVASRVGGLVETIDHGVTGLLIPPADPGAIVDALRTLEDDELRARLGAAAPASVERHSIAQSTEAMDAVWRALTSGGVR